MTRTPLPHGTRACYGRGCRRPECVKANRTYQRLWHANKRARIKAERQRR